MRNQGFGAIVAVGTDIDKFEKLAAVAADINTLWLKIQQLLMNSI